jgi:hypothetical protein
MYYINHFSQAKIMKNTITDPSLSEIKCIFYEKTVIHESTSPFYFFVLKIKCFSKRTSHFTVTTGYSIMALFLVPISVCI